MIIRPFLQNVLLNNSIYDDFLLNGLDLAPSTNYVLPHKKLQISLHPAACVYVIRNKPSTSSGYKKALQEMSAFANQYKPFRNVVFTLLKDEERKKLEEETSLGNKKLSKQFNFNYDLCDFFNWGKIFVPMPLPFKVRQRYQQIMGNQSFTR